MFRLKEININNFRAMREQKVKIPAETEVILLVGNNGLGKTSFFDAVEWGFTGTLRRYQAKSREKNSEVFLQNKYGQSLGSVELILNDETDNYKEDITIKRITSISHGNDFNSGELSVSGTKFNQISQLLLREGERENFDFNNSFNFTHLLSQEIISDFIRNYKEKERYSVLSGLVGIRSFDRYSV